MDWLFQCCCSAHRTSAYR